MSAPKSLHILCFGASLTAGYYNYGASHHPYSIALQRSLEASLPSVNIVIDVQGLSGDQVVSPPGGFLPRMDILYEEIHPENPYDWVIILGGTNDLGWGRTGKEIYSALQKVWAIPVLHQTKVLLLTVPECGNSNPVTTKRRGELNELILNHNEENFYTFDLHAAVPYWSMPEDKRKEIWDDGVHFTVEGYDLVGNLLASRLLELIGGKGDPKTEARKGAQSELKKRSQESVKD